MAYRSGLFNSVNGDRKYQAAHFAEYFATFIGNGVFPNPSNGLQVYAKENMTVTVKPGKAWINGYYFVNDSDCDLILANADGVLKRKDRIVLRFDTSTRLITPQIRKGVFSASPVAPAIQRDGDAYELALATVSIDKGTVALTQSSITDERLNTTVCGIVHGVVDQVDTATLFSQYQTWYAEKMEQYNTLMTNAETSFNNQLQAQQTAFDNQSATNQSTFDNQTVVNQQTFDEWLASLQTILDGDVAGNLLKSINDLDIKIDNVNTSLTKALLKKINSSEKGVANGVAVLNNDGKIDSSFLIADTKTETVVGSYVGTGGKKEIILGFVPKLVLVYGYSGNGNVFLTLYIASSGSFAVGIDSTPTARKYSDAIITTNGFSIASPSSASETNLNISSSTYHYIAYK